jgi:hypothetical protein
MQVINVSNTNGMLGVGIAQSVSHLCYDFDDQGIRVQFLAGIIFSIAATLFMGPTQSPVLWVLGTLPPMVTQPQCEVDHSAPSAVKLNLYELYLQSSLLSYMNDVRNVHSCYKK